MGMEFGLVMKIMIQWLMKSTQNPLNSMPMGHGIITALKQSSEGLPFDDMGDGIFLGVSRRDASPSGLENVSIEWDWTAFGLVTEVG